VNAQQDALRQNLRQHIDEALNQRGVVQEIILLRALNKAIDSFATTEADWRAASPLEYRRWREQLKETLDALAFMVDSADHYAQEPTELASDVAQATQQLRAVELRLQTLQTEKAALLSELNRTEAEAATLQHEVDLLAALKALAPFREAIKNRIDEQRLQAFADSELCRHQTHHRQHLESLTRQVTEQIHEIEASLKDSMTLTEQEWASLHQAATQVNARTSA